MIRAAFGQKVLKMLCSSFLNKTFSYFYFIKLFFLLSSFSLFRKNDLHLLYFYTQYSQGHISQKSALIMQGFQLLKYHLLKSQSVQ